MENENDLLNKKSGTVEPENKSLEPKIVTIEKLEVQTKKSSGDDFMFPLVNVFVKHPDKDELIKISKIKRPEKAKQVVQNLWMVLDEEQNIQKDSAVDRLIKYLNIETMADAVGKTMDTAIESDDSNFLVLKVD